VKRQDIALLQGLRDSLAPAAAAGETKAKRPSTVQRFLELDTTTDNGKPWSATGHEPLVAVIAAIERILKRKLKNVEIALLKAEQIGATHSIGLGPALFMAAEKGLQVGYFLPDEQLARRIASTRLKNLIRRSAYLDALMRDRSVTNQVFIKEFERGALHVLPLGTLTSAVSTPLDVRIYDEVDLLPAENTEWSEGRTAHSELNLAIWLSAGYAPGSGIDLKYQEGTQFRFLVDCKRPRCLRGMCLEEIFIQRAPELPECVEQMGDEHWRLVCPECKRPLDVKAGQWVAKEPKANVISYRLSQLAMTAMDLDRIVARYLKVRKKKSKLAKFKASVLALPDAGALQPFNDVALLRMQSGETESFGLRAGERPRYAGLDVGDMCHFVCFERLPNGDPHLVFATEIDSDHVEREVPKLCARLGVVSFVPDKKPHTNTMRAIAYEMGTRVALMDFVDNSILRVVEEEHEGNGHIYRCAKADRDEILEEMCDEFTDDIHYLRTPPVDAAPILELFVTHLKNLSKTEERDGKGRLVHKFRRGVENHFGLALCYAYVAEQIAPLDLPFNFWPLNEGVDYAGYGERRLIL